MNPVSKILVITGAVLIVAGILYSVGLGRLPGDIVIKKENFTFYFPVVTSIILSVIISVIVLLFNKK